MVVVHTFRPWAQERRRLELLLVLELLTKEELDSIYLQA